MRSWHVVVLLLSGAACSARSGDETVRASLAPESPASEPLALDFHHRCIPHTERVSVASDGAQGNGASILPSITADGRFVAFESGATNLVPGDTNGVDDIFVHDRATGETSRVSVSSSGVPADGASKDPKISADGRFVAFYSFATSFGVNPNPDGQAFVHDRVTGETSLVSGSSTGVAGDRTSEAEAISANGRYVAFWSMATNLVPNDTNDEGDIFVHDLQTGQTSRVSVSSTGAQQNGEPDIWASITGDGRYVAFTTSATDLAPGATNGQLHNYVHDLITGETSQVDVTTAGVSFLFADEPSLSLAGNVVVFDGATQIPGPEGFSVRVLPNGPTFFVPEKVGYGIAFPAPSSLGLRVAGSWEASANSADEIQVIDLLSGRTTIASVNDMGIQGTEGSSAAQMTGDGTAVTFLSNAPNLVPDDTNAEPDIFVRTLCEL